MSREIDIQHTMGPRRSTGTEDLSAKSMAELRMHIETLVRNNIGRLDGDLANLKSKERIDALIKLMEYVLPRLKETTAHVDGSLNQTIEASLTNIDRLFELKDRDNTHNREGDCY